MDIKVVYVEPKADSLAVYLPDTVHVGNWPAAALDPGPNLWVASILPIFVSAALGFLAAYWIYWNQKRDQRRGELVVAYNLYFAICDEMRRGRARVWNLIEHQRNRKYLKGRFVIDAGGVLLGRLVEVMPQDWKPYVVFRFYELLKLVASHHNRATEIPFSSQAESGVQLLWRMRRGIAPDAELSKEIRSGSDARQYALAFSLYYYDREGEDCLTSLYIEAVRELHDLARKAGLRPPSGFELPTEDERASQRAVVATMMKRPAPPEDPYGDLRSEVDDQDT